ncbi:MAG: GntR family transcriptional regulator [Anaerolineae bacterium]|nr:GntR family transcriptional regulator [Anaerolineae bacterium]
MNITIDKQSAVPYYHQLKEKVKALIASGELKPGDCLPGEYSLSEQLGSSRLVVHRAMRELVTEGLLIRMRAKGTFVAPVMKHRFMVTGPLFSTTEDLSIEALEPTNQVLLQEVIPTSEEVRQGLHLPPAATVIHLKNLRLAKGLPFAIEEIYLSHDRFPALASLNMNNHSLYTVLEKDYHAYPQESLDLISADSASRDEARLLGINTAAPVMRVVRTSTDREGQPVEYTRIVFHAGRYQLVARMHRTEG